MATEIEKLRAAVAAVARAIRDEGEMERWEASGWLTRDHRTGRDTRYVALTKDEMLAVLAADEDGVGTEAA